MSVLSIPRAVYDQIRSHGEQTYPHECCGVLLGQSAPEGWQVQSAVATGNMRTDSAQNRYQIAPLELIKIERDGRRQGLGIAGFYHSHPDHPAQWSLTDLSEAHWLGCSYVITAVAKGNATVTNSFLLTGDTEEKKRFDNEAILVDGQSIDQDGIEPAQKQT